MKKLLLIATGGTIACKRTGEGLSPLISSEELLEYVPGAKAFCTVDALQLFNLDSTNLRPQHWLAIAKAVEEHYDQYDGFVICHGTDTMGYTSAALSYLIQGSDKPIVITGAQRPIDMDNTDARTNLYDSLLFASDDQACGVSIVFDGKAIAGTRANKMRTKSYRAFSSINFPFMATIQDGRIVHYIKGEKTGKKPVFYHKMNDRVFLLKLIPGTNPEILRFVADRYDGIVIESYGVGGLPNGEGYDFTAVVKELIEKGKTVVMATQVVHEGSDMTIYKVGHMIKKEYGLLESFDMTLAATTTKLMWILGQTKDHEEIRKLFYSTIWFDILFQENEQQS